MSLLSMTDCSDAGNRIQARHELDRALEAGTFETIPSLANWADKWGRALLEYADAAPTEDDITADLLAAENEATAAEGQRDDYKDAIETAITDLDSIDGDALVQEQIDKIIVNLEKAL